MRYMHHMKIQNETVRERDANGSERCSEQWKRGERGNMGMLCNHVIRCLRSSLKLQSREPASVTRATRLSLSLSLRPRLPRIVGRSLLASLCQRILWIRVCFFLSLSSLHSQRASSPHSCTRTLVCLCCWVHVQRWLAFAHQSLCHSSLFSFASSPSALPHRLPFLLIRFPRDFPPASLFFFLLLPFFFHSHSLVLTTTTTAAAATDARRERERERASSEILRSSTLFLCLNRSLSPSFSFLLLPPSSFPSCVHSPSFTLAERLSANAFSDVTSYCPSISLSPSIIHHETT